MVLRSANTTVINMLSSKSWRFGIVLMTSNATKLMNISLLHNVIDGIFLQKCTDTTMMNITTTNNENIGINVLFSNATVMMNILSSVNLVCARV